VSSSKRLLFAVVVLFGSAARLLCVGAGGAQSPNGEAIYKRSCAQCHDVVATHAPGLNALRMMSAEIVLQALETGSMKPMASLLNPSERRAVAEFASGKPLSTAAPVRITYCATRSSDFSDSLHPSSWNGWSPGLDNTRFQPDPGFRISDIPKLRLRWAFGIPNASISFAQPAVVNGHVFLGTASSAVYSLDAKTGCTDWVFQASAGVRNGISIGMPPGLSRYAAFFGDLSANVYAVDAGTGTLIWKTNVEHFRGARITGSPVLYENRLYVPISIIEEGLAVDPKYECCRARPSVVALDASTGKEIWRHYTIDEEAHRTGKNPIGTQLWGPSGASVWSAPTLDPQQHSLYVGTGNNFSSPATNTSDAILALSMDTGKLLWSRQITADDTYNVACVSVDQSNCPKPAGPDWDFGSSPILVKLASGKRALLAGQKSGVVTALDPDNRGEILWQTRIGRGGWIGGIEWGPATDGVKLYAALSDMWWLADRVFDPQRGGGLYALDIATGAKVWTAPPPSCEGRKNCSPAQSAAVSAVPGVVFSGSEDGHIRAYSSENGEIIWDFNTEREFTTVNNVPAKGGSIDGPGPAIADGMVYVPSGYGTWGGLSGNVLLAFSVDNQ